MNRVGNKGAMCPLFCCLFLNKCCGMDDDDEFDDLRQPIMKQKHLGQYDNYLNYKRSKPKSTSKRNKNRLVIVDPYFVSPSPILHSGLKRLPFNGTLSDLTERSEDESLVTTLASTNFEFDDHSFFQREEPSLHVISESEYKINLQEDKDGGNDKALNGMQMQGTTISKNTKDVKM